MNWRTILKYYFAVNLGMFFLSAISVAFLGLTTSPDQNQVIADIHRELVKRNLMDDYFPQDYFPRQAHHDFPYKNPANAKKDWHIQKRQVLNDNSTTSLMSTSMSTSTRAPMSSSTKDSMTCDDDDDDDNGKPHDPRVPCGEDPLVPKCKDEWPASDYDERRFKLTIFLLAVIPITGMCGCDRCFAGFGCLGVLKAFTLGGVTIWYWIDWIMLLTNSWNKDVDGHCFINNM